MSIFSVSAEAVAECQRQNAIWGDQREHTPAQWLAILTEEVGEVAKEVADSMARPIRSAQYRTELVQVAAVALQSVWAFDRMAISSPTEAPEGGPYTDVTTFDPNTGRD